jgi:hypothetical protein
LDLSLETRGGAGPGCGPGTGTGLPGVVVVHGPEGRGAGWSRRFAAILAAHGRRCEAAGRPAELFAAQGQGRGYGAEPAIRARLPAFFGRHLG